MNLRIIKRKIRNCIKNFWYDLQWWLDRNYEGILFGMVIGGSIIYFLK